MNTQQSEASVSNQRKRMYGAMTHIGHGDLSLFTGLLPLAHADPYFYAHLTAWNHVNTQVRDSQVALPVIGMRANGGDREWAENAVAHLAKLGPRELVRAVQFSRELTKRGDRVQGGAGNMLEGALKGYLAIREAKPSWWDKTVVSNREAMLTLYTISHTKPSPRAQAILFDKQYPKDSVFAAIAGLKNMSPKEQAAAIQQYGIPFPIVIGALPNIKGNREVLLPLIDGMTGAQVLNNTEMLKRLGVMVDPMLMSAYNDALQRATTDKRVSAKKIDQVVAKQSDSRLAQTLQTVQDAAIANAKKIDGNVSIEVDRSGSMARAIELGKMIASQITARVNGKVYLSFYDDRLEVFEVQDKTYNEIVAMTRHIKSRGSTACGLPLQNLRQKNIPVDMVVQVTDGGDNHNPYFHESYPAYVNAMGVEPVVYEVFVGASRNYLSDYAERNGINVEVIDASDAAIDQYSVGNIVNMLRPGTFGLEEEINTTPLLTLSDIFAN